MTTTGVHPLKKAKSPGGYQVTLPKLDQTAVILASPDPLQRDPIEERPTGDRADQARIWIELAKAKLARVAKVDAELTALGHDQPDGRTLLFRAQQSVAHAERCLSKGTITGPGKSRATPCSCFARCNMPIGTKPC